MPTDLKYLGHKEKGPVENHDRGLERPLDQQDQQVVVAKLVPHLLVDLHHLVQIVESLPDHGQAVDGRRHHHEHVQRLYQPLQCISTNERNCNHQ